MEDIGYISIHLHYESIKYKKKWFRNGPVKSIWTLVQGQLGHFHGINSATGGVEWFFWYSVQLFFTDPSLPYKKSWLLPCMCMHMYVLGSMYTCVCMCLYVYVCACLWMRFKGIRNVSYANVNRRNYTNIGYVICWYLQSMIIKMTG